MQGAAWVLRAPAGRSDGPIFSLLTIDLLLEVTLISDYTVQNRVLQGGHRHSCSKSILSSAIGHSFDIGFHPHRDAGPSQGALHEDQASAVSRRSGSRA